MYDRVCPMLPVLFSIGKISVSSFGVFLTLGILVGVLLIWRLSRAWDLDEEKVLDLTLLTFIGGFIGARLYFGLQHPSLFSDNYLKIFFINKLPGFSFWGALLGGWLTLFFASKVKRINFYQVADIAFIGFLGSLIFTSLGCFFGSCNVGIQSKIFFAVNMVGFVGKRFPTQILETILLTIVLFSIWSTAIHFHTRGKILSLTLIYIGLIKFIMEPLKQNHEGGFVLSFALLLLGVTFLYKVTKRNVVSDLKSSGVFILQLFTNRELRKLLYLKFKRYCYNRKTLILWNIRNMKKRLRRKNVRFS